MSTKEEILDAISNMSVIELKELLDAFEVSRVRNSTGADVSVSSWLEVPAAHAEVVHPRDMNVVS